MAVTVRDTDEAEARSHGGSGGGQRTITPYPDPSTLTTDALRREIGHLADALKVQMAAMEALTDEKFRSVDQQLALVERQRVEQKSDTKAAVDAALTAQKEAVKEQTTATATAIAKSETITSEQLKQLGVNFTTAIGALTSTLNDLKERVAAIESARLGGREAIGDQRATGAADRAIVSFGIMLVLAAITVVGFLVANQ